MKKYLLAIPCYNCKDQVIRIIDEIDGLKYKNWIHFLFVDNQSKDATLETIRYKISRKQKHFLILNNKNYGLGGSHKIIFTHAIKENYDYVIVLHGDNQAKTSEVDDFINENIHNPKEAILGSRFMKKSKLLSYSKIRIFGNIIINIMYTIFLRRSIKDLGSGLNLYKVNCLKKIKFLDFDDGFTFNMDLLISLIKKNNDIIFRPITWSEIDQISNAKALNVAIKAIKKLFIDSKVKKAEEYVFKKII
jgi:hypothetical protein